MTQTLPTSTIDAVREALKPFAAHAEGYYENWSDDMVAQYSHVTVGDLRKAAAALALLDGNVLERDNG